MRRNPVYSEIIEDWPSGVSESLRSRNCFFTRGPMICSETFTNTVMERITRHTHTSALHLSSPPKILGAHSRH